MPIEQKDKQGNEQALTCNNKVCHNKTVRKQIMRSAVGSRHYS